MDSSKPTFRERAWTTENEELQEGFFYIRDPRNLTRRHAFKTLDEAMKYFKGFNYPYCKDDNFVQTVQRVVKWFQTKYTQTPF